MQDDLEFTRPSDRVTLELRGDRITIGSAPSNDITIGSDRGVSRLHAVLHRYPAGWSIEDLGSRNGTSVNGERTWAEQRLRTGDELRVGRTHLVLHATAGPDADLETESVEAAPELTACEREVLVELCRPLLGGDAFTPPASIREIAERLVVTDAAVKQHLLKLYRKFRIPAEGRRRVLLANAAIDRGAVTLASLRDDHAR